MKDPITTIGQKLTGNENRDAIHIAILACQVADDYLSPGAEVGLVYGTKDQIKARPSVYNLEPIGVVDPFLAHRGLRKGDWCWVFLKPNSVTGMRHHWQHPAVDEAERKWNEEHGSKDLPETVLKGLNRLNENSQDWLRKFADKWNFNYDEMVAGAQEHGGHVVAGGLDLHSASELDEGDEQLFWHHIEQLTGKKFDDDHRKVFGWSCSC